jgi:signal transduction histidine kinase/ligand-binding sensor domain-containing protein
MKFSPSLVAFKVILLVFLGSVNLLAQNLRLLHITTNNGLPENTGQALLQDGQGFIWIGTQNGLARFDGVNFKVYKNRPKDSTSLSNNQIEGLFQDDNGFIWVATRNGLNRFDPINQTFTRFLPEGQESSGKNWFRQSIAQGSDGRIWAMTFHGLYRIDDWQKQAIHYFPFPNQKKRHLCAFTLAGQNQVWANASDSIFKVVDDSLAYQGRVPFNAISVLNVGEQLLLATQAGVYAWSKASKRVEARFSEHLQNVFCLRLYQDQAGIIWVATTSGLYAFKEKKLIYHFKNDPANAESLSNNLVLDIIEDTEGLIWIGTGQGINQFDARQNRFLRITSSSKGPIQLADPQVEVIHWQDDQTLWLATATALHKITLSKPVSLSRLAPSDWPIKKIVKFSAANQPQLQKDNIDFITNAPNGGVFIGTRMGKLLSINANEQITQLNNYPNYRQLRGIYHQPHTQLLWCGSADGLYVHHLAKNKSFIPSWLPPVDVVQMGVFQNQLWAGTPQGVFVVDLARETYQIYTGSNTKGKLNNTMLTHLLPTDSVLWFTTFGGGLYKFEPEKKTFTNYSEAEGLINSNVWGVYADANSKLWLSTDNGVANFDPKTQQFKSYEKQDGLNFPDFSMTAHAQSLTGELWFGNPEGLSVFHPDNLTEEVYLPKTSLIDLEINYEKASQRLRQLLETQKLVLNPEDKTITFVLAALSYRNPEKNQLAFALDGYDENWVYRSAKEQKITYTSLPPGDYTLRVKSATKSGDWGEEYTLALQVIPPFYKTAWFRALAGLALILMVGGIILLYNRRKYGKQIAALETQQKIQGERERISKDLHDHVGAHLTRIITDLDILSLQLDKLPAEENLEKIDHTRSFTQGTVQLLRDTIWAINQDSYTTQEFAYKAEAFLEQYLGDLLAWEVKRSITNNLKLSPNQVLNLLRILQEATQNMLKHAGATVFKVTISSGTTFRVTLKDNGKGMEAATEKRGHYGLVNMQKRAKDIGGALHFETAPGKGMKITINL